MDPEHRKYVFAEEYQDGSDRSLKDQFKKEDQQQGLRRRSSSGKRGQDRARLGNVFKFFLFLLQMSHTTR